MPTHLVLALTAMVVALPVTAVALRRTRQRTYRELSRRLERGEIAAGVPSNWLTGSGRLQWSGCLTIVPGVLRWEPDHASVRRDARSQEWLLDQLRVEVARSRRSFTGERSTVMTLLPAWGEPTTFTTFAGIGPWDQLLGLLAG